MQSDHQADRSDSTHLTGKLAVEVLARETGVSADVVERLLAAELAKLATGATITNYLVVLACRRVRERIRQ